MPLQPVTLEGVAPIVKQPPVDTTVRVQVESVARPAAAVEPPAAAATPPAAAGAIDIRRPPPSAAASAAAVDPNQAGVVACRQRQSTFQRVCPTCMGEAKVPADFYVDTLEHWTTRLSQDGRFDRVVIQDWVALYCGSAFRRSQAMEALHKVNKKEHGMQPCHNPAGFLATNIIDAWKKEDPQFPGTQNYKGAGPHGKGPTSVAGPQKGAASVAASWSGKSSWSKGSDYSAKGSDYSDHWGKGSWGAAASSADHWAPPASSVGSEWSQGAEWGKGHEKGGKSGGAWVAATSWVWRHDA